MSSYEYLLYGTEYIVVGHKHFLINQIVCLWKAKGKTEHEINSLKIIQLKKNSMGKPK
jgi:hypothetical protein